MGRSRKRNTLEKTKPTWRGRLGSNFGLVWGTATLIIVIIFATVAVYTQNSMRPHDSRDTARMLEQCRKTPVLNSKVCEDLLIARGDLKEPRYSRNLRGPQKVPFRLTESESE